MLIPAPAPRENAWGKPRPKSLITTGRGQGVEKAPSPSNGTPTTPSPVAIPLLPLAAKNENAPYSAGRPEGLNDHF